MINWSNDKNTVLLIEKIAARAETKMWPNADCNKLTIMTAIEACHCNGNPLDLQRLLEANDGDFLHDVFGIVENINRETGRIKNYFSPRCSLTS
jgi:hypothetical protein